MIILWIKRPDRDEPYRKNNGDDDSFRKHDDNMKRFRVGHPKIEPVRPNQANPANFLIPLREVKLAEHSRN